MSMYVWRAISGYQDLLSMLDPRNRSEQTAILLIKKEIRSLCSGLSDDDCDEISEGAPLH